MDEPADEQDPARSRAERERRSTTAPTRHREYTNPIEIPRVDEMGDTAGGDSTAPRVNPFAGGGFFR